jgi:hypothetical protein
MNNTEANNMVYENKKAIIFDDSQIVVAHGNLTVEISNAVQTDEIDLSHIPDNEFHEMMKTPDNFKIVKNKKIKTLERK